MRRLFIPGYYSGFSNNRMSLDIGVVLAYLTGRVLVPYRFRLPQPYPVQTSGDFPAPLFLPHLFDIPVAWSDEYLLKTWVSAPGAVECPWGALFDSVLSLPGNLAQDSRDFQQFRNGRSHAYSLDQRQDEAADLLINAQTLAHYSHFFYLDEERHRQVIGLMQRFRPKRPYLDAADRIAAGLGSFNAIHLRRGDFIRNELTRKKITRAVSVSGQEIVRNLASRMQRDDLLVICTDGSPRDELFGPILQYFRKVIFLDSYLSKNDGVRQIISELPSYNDAVLVLLNQLVASRARVFAGTLFSTFTALIHRLRGLDGRDSSFLYCYNDCISPLTHFKDCEFLPVDDGPYSWNRVRYPVSPDACSWFREWPEAFDARSPSGGEAPPAGILDLLPDGASLHGSAIRVMVDPGGRRVIGDWNDAGDFVSWDLSVPEGGEYLVEIRYGCGEESSGSRYSIGLAGNDPIEARVWNTGSSSSVSPWLPLGFLSMPAGRSSVVLRVTEQGSGSVMNLHGVRLVPRWV